MPLTSGSHKQLDIKKFSSVPLQRYVFKQLLVCKTFVCGQIKILEFQVLLCWAGDRTTKMTITDGQMTTSQLTVKLIGQPAVFLSQS
jgi:hypothetical protein